MDYTLFIKNKFLNQPIDKFAKSFDKVDYNGFEKIVANNTVLGMGRIATKVCRKSVRSVFDSVDGIPLQKSAANPLGITRKDGFVDRDEMYQLIKDSYESIYGKKISPEELSKMTVKDAIDLVIKSNCLKS